MQRNVIIEMRRTSTAAKMFSMAVPSAFMMAPVGALEGVLGIEGLQGFDIDASFGPVPLPRRRPEAHPRGPADSSFGFALVDTPEESTWLIRGRIEDAAAVTLSLENHPDINHVYADSEIGISITCPNSPALGDAGTVAGLLGAEALAANGMNGSGVLLAIVDTGFNLDFLQTQGKVPAFEAGKSWVPYPDLSPGNLPLNHGTMCAYDALIGAPAATLIDVPVLLSKAPGGSVVDGLLSDAVRAYTHLLGLVTGGDCPKGLVVSNSWGMYQTSWDFPPGSPGRYADNPDHPFNRIVGSLERSGADILFAAGNCGRECPSSKCGGVTDSGITGANSHPQVLCVGGVDTHLDRVGYSSSGPGLLERRKPDICGFTHFAGSGVYPVDTGTSAACPVVAGLVAAFRSRFPFDPQDSATFPGSVRGILRKTAISKGALGFDFDHGWGIANGPAMAAIRSLTA